MDADEGQVTTEVDEQSSVRIGSRVRKMTDKGLEYQIKVKNDSFMSTFHKLMLSTRVVWERLTDETVDSESLRRFELEVKEGFDLLTNIHKQLVALQPDHGSASYYSHAEVQVQGALADIGARAVQLQQQEETVHYFV